MRIAKKAIIRKRELVDAAIDLFAEKGYENTSVDDIINKVGVTKGAFYYYFKSKEQVMEEFDEILVEPEVKAFDQALSDSTLSPAEKLSLAVSQPLSEIPELNQRDQKAFRAFRSVGNAKFYHKHNQFLETRFIPLYRRIIEAGISAGAFSLPSPADTAWLCLTLYRAAYSKLTTLYGQPAGEKRNAEVDQYLSVFNSVMERILGAAPGTMSIDKRLREAFGLESKTNTISSEVDK
jgi:AcrR family transcriptional regulator